MGVARWRRPSLGAILLAALILATVWAGIVVALPFVNARGGAPPRHAFHGAVADPPLVVPEIELIDEQGEPARLSDYRGQVVVLFFGYTYCPDVCPLTLQELARAKHVLGADGEHVRVFLVTVDPERDTPARMAGYLRLVDSAFGGLTGTPEALRALYQAFGVRAEKESAPNSVAGYLVAHTSLSYVIDKQGKLRLALPMGTKPEDTAADLRALVREGTG